MKFSYEFKVDSNMMIEDEISYQENDKTFVLIPNERKLIASIKIITKIRDLNLIQSFYTSNSDNKVGSIVFEMDKGLAGDLLSEFQIIEAMLAFPEASLREIRWDTIIYEIIPETEEEKLELKKRFTVLKGDWKRSYEDGKILTKDVFIENMKNRYKFKDILIPRAFFHEGMYQFKKLKYISAFYSFYYIIEDFYGGGNSKNSLVTKSLKESEEFRSYVQWATDNIVNDNNKKHYNSISSFLKICNKNFDVDGIIHLVVNMRGQLHHYNGTSTILQGTPLNHVKFESLAYLTMQIALRGILGKMMLINTQGIIQ